MRMSRQWWSDDLDGGTWHQEYEPWSAELLKRPALKSSMSWHLDTGRRDGEKGITECGRLVRVDREGTMDDAYAPNRNGHDQRLCAECPWWPGARKDN